jgi:hypothetical protein
MRNVAGIPQTEAQKSTDLYMKCRYMDELTGGKGIIFATGTPISNSMSECYTMMRYLQNDTLKEHGWSVFDSWASMFGETVTAIELAPEGTGYRAKTRFSKFYNLPELMNAFKEAADVKTADELDLPRPKANYRVVAVNPTQEQKDLMQTLSDRAAAIHRREVASDQDNMLCVTSDGRKIGLDQRLIDPLLPDDPESKVNACMENVYRIWDETKKKRLTQLVFSDFSTPSKDKFNVYDDIKTKLAAKGVPDEEIAYIHNADTEIKKKELFAKVRKGAVRILMGSTAKMGSGTNVQNLLIALHDLDCPWRPADLEQRSGRIVRQGNKNPEVDVYRYVTKSTFDAYLFQTVENKQKFISQIMTSKSPARSCEDVDESVLNYAEVKALCIGDLRIKEKMDLDIQVSKLRMLESSHRSQQYQLQDSVLKYYPKEIERTKGRITGLEKDLSRWRSHANEEFFMTVGTQTFGKDRKKEAGMAIIEARKTFQGLKSVANIGTYKGFEMSLSYNFPRQTFELSLKADGVPHVIDLGGSESGNFVKMDNALEKIPEWLERSKAHLEDLKKQLEDSKIARNQPFAQAEELREKTTRLAELDVLLNMDEEQQAEEQQEEEQTTEQEETPGDEDDDSARPVDSVDVDFIDVEANGAPQQDFEPKIGQRVAFHAHEGNGHVTGKVIDTSEAQVVIQSGALEIPVLRRTGTFAEAPELDKTETLAYARDLAQRHVGEQGVVFPALKTGTYNGPIVEFTPAFALQQTSENVVVLHRLKDLNGKEEIRQGANISICRNVSGISISVMDKNLIEREGCRR